MILENRIGYYMRKSWEEYALTIAKKASEQSKDPYKQVGCCILRKNNAIASVGFNGEPSKKTIDWSNREARRPLVIHAEMNAYKFAAPFILTEDVYLAATTLSPCIECFKNLVNIGITKIVYSGKNSNPNYDTKLVEDAAKAWDIEYIHIPD